MSNPLEALATAINSSDAAGVAQVIERHPELKARLNDPLPGLAFDSLPLLIAVSRGNQPMIETLLQAGADINARSRWWAGGFGALDSADPSLVPFLLECGAQIDAHAAARLGMLEKLNEQIAASPELVHARGGDGQTPLHFASTVEVARFLIDRGADINARDIDHESTPAQYMVRDRQDVARYLVARGCQTDVLLTTALGDAGLVRHHLDRDPASIRTTVSEQYFPKQNARSGGTIYIWTLGAHKTPHLVAREFGHEEIFWLLMERSPAALKLAVACELGEEPLVKELLASDPKLPAALTDADRMRLAHAARDENARALHLMLTAGWPVDARGQHHATALHWAAFHGNLEIAADLLAHGAPVDVRGDEYDGTPLHWAIHGSVHGWRCRTGDYAGTVAALINAGAQVPKLTPDFDASEPVREVLRRHASDG